MVPQAECDSQNFSLIMRGIRIDTPSIVGALLPMIVSKAKKSGAISPARETF